MKKLSLKNLKLDANDLLQREQLKTVFGGYGGYGTDYSGGCAYTYSGIDIFGSPYTVTNWSTGLSLSQAQGFAEDGMNGGASSAHYCCASCNDVAWLP